MVRSGYKIILLGIIILAVYPIFCAYSLDAPFSIHIEPEEAEVRAGGTVNYRCEITASPDFHDSINFKIKVNVLFWNVTQNLGTVDPPYPKEFSYDLEIPEEIPGEEVRVTATIIGTSVPRGTDREFTVEETVELIISGPSIPGFPVESITIGLIIGIIVMWMMRRRS